MTLYVMNRVDYRLVQHMVHARMRRHDTPVKYKTWDEAHYASHELLHGSAHQCHSHNITVSEIEADFGAMDFLVPSDLWARHVAPLGVALQPGDILGWRAILAHEWEGTFSVPWERLGVHLLRTMGDTVNFYLWETYIVNRLVPASQLMAILKRDFPAMWVHWNHQAGALDKASTLG